MGNEQLTKVTDPTETEATPVAAESPIVEFPVKGRISVRGDGQSQNAYNLLILDVDAHDALVKLSGFEQFSDMQATNEQGESWVSVTIDPAGKAKIRQAGRQGATKIVVDGILTIVDIKNNKAEGFMRVTGARAANLLDGGRIFTRESREPATAQAAMPALGLRRGARA